VDPIHNIWSENSVKTNNKQTNNQPTKHTTERQGQVRCEALHNQQFTTSTKRQLYERKQENVSQRRDMYNLLRVYGLTQWVRKFEAKS
jgi:hypothetical protein